MALISFRLRRVLWFGLFVLGTGAILIASKVVLQAAAPASAALPALALLMLQNACALAFGLLGRAWPRRPRRWWVSLLPSALLLGASQFAVLRVLAGAPVAAVILFRAAGTALVCLGDLLTAGGARRRLLSAAGVIALGGALALAADPLPHGSQWAWLGAHSALWATDRLTERRAARAAVSSPAELSFAKHAATLPPLALALALVLAGGGGGGGGGLLSWLAAVPKGALLCAAAAAPLVSRCYLALSRLSSFTKITLVGGGARLATAFAGAVWFGEGLGAVQLAGVALAVFGTLMAAFVPRTPSSSSSSSSSSSASSTSARIHRTAPGRPATPTFRTARARGADALAGGGECCDGPDTPTFLRQELAQLHANGQAAASAAARHKPKYSYRTALQVRLGLHNTEEHGDIRGSPERLAHVRRRSSGGVLESDDLDSEASTSRTSSPLAFLLGTNNAE